MNTHDTVTTIGVMKRAVPPPNSLCPFPHFLFFGGGKGVSQGYILSSCLFNLYAEYIMWNTGLDESQTGIKSAGRNINNLRYADDMTLNGRKQRS